MVYRLALVVLLALYGGQVQAGEISGKARAIDGDTLRIGETQVRLYGIDAPELAQTCTSKKGKLKYCGELARRSLDALIKHAPIICKPVGKDADGATTATCMAGPFDIGEQMLADGWAFAVLGEVPAYARAEAFAKARSEGIWRGGFISPEQWRKENSGQ